MNKNYLYLFLIVLVFFVPTFLRPATVPIAGADTYYFLNQTFDKTSFDKLTTPISNFIFHHLPQNIFLIKVIMMLTTFVCLLIFYQTIKVNYPKAALFGSFVMLSVFFYAQVFFRLEDDLFGMIFLMVALLYIEKFNKTERSIGYTIKEKYSYLFISILYLALACSIWKFCVFFFIVFYLFTNFNKLYGICCILLIPFLPKLIGFIIPNMKVSENALGFIGIFTIVCFIWVYAKLKSIRSTFVLPILIFSVSFIINSKVMFAIVPILILALCEVFETSKNRQRDMWLFYGCLFVGSLSYSYMDFPSTQDYNLLMYSKEQSIELGKPLEINWGSGYFAQYHDFDTNYFGSYKKQDIIGKVYYAATKEDCNVLKKGMHTISYSC